MREKMESLQNEVVDMQQQLQVVNEVVVNHLEKISGLEEQNVRLKKFLLGDCGAQEYEDMYIVCYGQGLSI